MGLFSDMKDMGVNLDNVYKEETRPNPKTKVQAQKMDPLTEESVLFDKSYKCPVCDQEYKAKAVRTGKLKMISQDDDLRPVYDLGIDPLKYDVVICPRCGYAVMPMFMGGLTSMQIRTLKNEYCVGFQGIEPEEPCMSYEGAITRMKLALVCALKRNAKNSEKAYIFLRLAWLLRGQRAFLQELDLEAEDSEEDELDCLQRAYDGFNLSFSKENFPICGMDEVTMMYLMANLAFELGDYENAAKTLARVLSSKTTPQRIKNKGLDLKEKIKEAIIENQSK